MGYCCHLTNLIYLGAVFWAGAGTILAGTTDFESQYYSLALSRTTPAFASFVVDSLGRGRLGANPVLLESAGQERLRFESPAGGEFAYFTERTSSSRKPAWSIICKEKIITLRSEFSASEPLLPLVLTFNQKSNHATLLGLMKPGDRRMLLPCVLHLPDMGSCRITGNRPGLALDYDARRFVKPAFVRVAFPPATAAWPRVEYRLEIAAIFPKVKGSMGDPLYDGFRRDFLNIFQVNPRVQMLANNASSDPVAFTLFKYAEVARLAPPLVEGLTALDLVRMTLDRYLAGAKGYGQIGYAPVPDGADIIGWQTPWNALDSNPSLIIAAGNYIEGAPDWRWARANYNGLLAWAREMMAGDRDGNGLIEYPGSGNLGDRPTAERRPANWWDTINFGHEDAYANALAYRACHLFAAVARRLGHPADADFFTARAAKLRAAYLPAFLNPATGVLAGWRSQDGQLHDYWFTFVSGVAITYGLVDEKDATAIMDRLLSKMSAVGYTNFSLGLPGNLIPVRKGDYVLHNSPPTKFGEPSLDDGSDGFQFYENGGATGCFTYFTIKALFKLNRRGDAQRIFHPMLAGYAAGNFQGFCDDGMSKDWRDWRGGCHGYEGLLVDNYLALLAVFDDLSAFKP
jgi:hypothetical protein